MSAHEDLYDLELALARRHAGAIPGGYVAVLDEGSTEFGASGRAWTRSDMLALLEAAPRTETVSLEAFDATEVVPGTYLVTYDAVGILDGRRVRRRRSWLRRGERFVLRFHPGTPVPDDS